MYYLCSLKKVDLLFSQIRLFCHQEVHHRIFALLLQAWQQWQLMVSRVESWNKQLLTLFILLNPWRSCLLDMEVRLKCSFFCLIPAPNVITPTLMSDKFEVRLNNDCIEIFNSISLKIWWIIIHFLTEDFYLFLPLEYSWCCKALMEVSIECFLLQPIYLHLIIKLLY